MKGNGRLKGVNIKKFFSFNPWLGLSLISCMNGSFILCFCEGKASASEPHPLPYFFFLVGIQNKEDCPSSFRANLLFLRPFTVL